MKMEHVELLWESLSKFEKENITFDEFLERLGKSLESATLVESKLIGEAARELDFALSKRSDKNKKVRKIIAELMWALISEKESMNYLAVSRIKAAA